MSKRVAAISIPPQADFEERHLEVYSKCPARYRYEVIDGLRGPGDDTPYLKFHGCVRKTIRWIFDEIGDRRCAQARGRRRQGL